MDCGEASMQTHKTSYIQLATDSVYNVYLNCFLRETTGWEKIFQIPTHDVSLARHMKSGHYDRLLKITLKSLSKEIFCPLVYFSLTGRHEFAFPVMMRAQESNALTELSLVDFARLTGENYLQEQGIDDRVGLGLFLERLCSSVENITTFVYHRHKITEDLDDIFAEVVSFIDAEQSLLFGHAMHPVAKSRIGFDYPSLLRYSPEAKGPFQLHYFLASAEVVWEAHVDTSLSDVLKAQLLQDPNLATSVRALLCNPDGGWERWRVLPCHPWQAVYLSQQVVMQELLDQQLLVSLGECGPYYSATSSVRTVYSDASDYMLKFSLNVQITNSERINLPKELMRGYEFAKLMQTPFGETLKEKYPCFEAVTDPAFLAIRYKGEVIHGFSVVARDNPFRCASTKNLSVMAAWCQDPILPHHQNRLVKTIGAIANRENRSVRHVALEWFDRFLEISLVPFVKIYNSHGLFLEAHGQNTLLEVDENGYPVRFYFRDNQGYFFREGGEAYARHFLPQLGRESLCIASIDFLNPKFTYYFVINTLLTVVNTLGRAHLVEEVTLLERMADTLRDLLREDSSGWVAYMLTSRDLEAKANLLTRLHDYDELIRPLETHAVYVDFPNPFLMKYFSKALIAPDTLDTVFFKGAFSNTGSKLQLSLRPLDVERDIEMLHEWFHRKHTIAYWAMNKSLQMLETFYVNLQASDYSHAFIGEINGTPAFVTEYYWCARDPVGKYYDTQIGDYGMHICIAAEKKEQRHSVAVIRTILDYLFSQPEVERCIGESHRDAKAALGLFEKVGYVLQRVIALPHKPANLTVLTRENYALSEPDTVNNGT
ncbi:MAG: GNAT family N-acetyltransferase [Exilibacterium sp.]